METVGITRAKMYFAKLLERVSRGEMFTLTKHGVPMALLVPIGSPRKKLAHGEIVQGMRSLRKKIKTNKMNVRQMIEEGRRFLKDSSSAN